MTPTKPPAMTFQERALYHQIHPLKLATDILATPPAIALFWAHQLIPALLVTFAPSIAVSAALLRWGRLERQRDSAFGHYLARTMTPATQAVRSFSIIVFSLGAWLRSWPLVALGLLIVALAWTHGLRFSRPKGSRETNAPVR